MGSLNIYNTSGANKASLTFTGSSDKTVDANTVLQSTDSTASIANGKVVVDSSGNVGIGTTPSAWRTTTGTGIQFSQGSLVPTWYYQMSLNQHQHPLHNVNENRLSLD